MDFVDKLPGTKGRGCGVMTPEVREELKKNRDKWAEITITKSQASGSSYRRYWGHKGFEFAQRTIDGTIHIFARYVGKDQS